MKHLLPDRVEIVVLAAVAVLCAGMAWMTQARDISFAVCSIPLTTTAMLMGMRRHWRMQESRERERVQSGAELD